MRNKLLKYINNMDFRRLNNNSSKYTNFIKAIGINICFLIFFLFAFEPTPKQDDYDQAMVLYGGFTGKYSPYSQYTNYIFSKLVQILIQIFPKISWYYVIQYIIIFASLTAITFIFVKKGTMKEWLVPVFSFMSFCSYEIYIRFTFTKVAGISIIAGFLILLYLIETQKKISFRYIIGIAFVFLGVLIRGAMYNLIVEVFFSAFIIYMIRERKENRRIYISKLFIFILIVGSMYCCNRGLNLLNVQMRSKDAAWESYTEKNGARVALQDYGVPEYSKHEKEYSAINVTENDYNAWKKEAIYTDYDFFTPDLLQKIKEIESKKKGMGAVKSAFKGMLQYYLSDTGIFLFFSAIMFLLFAGFNCFNLYFLPIGGCCLFAYIYMYCMGRLQHHVDVTVLIAGAILLFYYCIPIQKAEIFSLKQCCLSFGILIIIFVGVNFEGLSHSSYYGMSYGSGKSQREEYEKNKENLELISEDTEHLYLVGAYSTTYICNREWTIFDVVKPGYYHNIISSNLYYLPHVHERMANYNVDNMYKEMVNSDILYAVSVDENPTFIDILCTYISEHYKKDVYYTKVKEVDNINIYRFTSGDIRPSWKGKKMEDSSDVISDVNITKTEDNKYIVDGYAYIDGIDSYAQNIYIGVEDMYTGMESYFYALQSENDLFLTKDKYHGRYSSFYGEFFHYEDIQVNIYVETEDRVYQLKIENEEYIDGN